VSDPALLLDVEAIADRARSLWRDARDRATTAHVELFAKVACVDLASCAILSPSEREAGSAVGVPGVALRRVQTRDYEHAGVRGCLGASRADVVRWAADTACAFRCHCASLSAPPATDSVADERWDLDASRRVAGVKRP
jgi:hypothetical protein